MLIKVEQPKFIILALQKLIKWLQLDSNIPPLLPFRLILVKQLDAFGLLNPQTITCPMGFTLAISCNILK